MAKPVFIASFHSGYAHTKCYLSHTNGCSTKISREHFISHNLLNKVEKHNKTIDIVGLNWLPKDQLTSIGKQSLVSNILCDQHNSALSPLDSSIGDLVDAISAIDAEYRSEKSIGKNYQVNGAHIERWILKTIYGLVKSGQIKQSSGDFFELKEKCLELLCLPTARWPLGWGLYVAIPQTEIYHSSSFELTPLSNPTTNELLALNIKFNGIEMNFLMGKPNHVSAFGVHRPGQLTFEKMGVKSNIIFNWPKQKIGQSITYSYAGSYSGTSPDHKLPFVK